MRRLLAFCLFSVTAGASPIASANFHGTGPQVFEKNLGQAHKDVRFIHRGSGDAVHLSDRGLSLAASIDDETRVAVFRADFVSASAATWRGEEKLAGRINYMIGKNAKRWVTHVPTFRQVRAAGVWPGVDVVFSKGEGRLRFDFVVRTAKAASQILLRFPGTHFDTQDQQVELQNDAMTVRLTRLFAYQDIAGLRKEVPVRFVQRDGGLGFELGAHDVSYPITIDPTLDYATYLSGGSADFMYAIDVDASERVYVAGSSNVDALLYPTTTGAFQAVPPTGASGASGVLTKIDPSQTGAASLVYSTFIKGPNNAGLYLSDVAIDPAGRAYLAGRFTGNGSTGFPTSPGAQRTDCAGSQSFASIISADGSALDYGTCFYSGDTRMTNVAVHPNGHMLVAGVTTRNTAPVAGPNNALWDILMLRIDPTAAAGSQYVFEATIGGVNTERLQDLQTDAAGRLVIVTPSGANAPTTAGVVQPVNVDSDMYVAVVDTLQPELSSLAWATYAGGAGRDDNNGGGADAYAVDSSGNVFVASTAVAFPTTVGTVSPTPPAATNSSVIFKVSPDGTQILWATYLPFRANVRGIDIGPDGEVVVTGRNFGAIPVSACAVETSNTVMYLARLDAAGTLVEYLTYAPGDDLTPNGLAVGSSGAVYIAGDVRSTGNVVVVGGAQTASQGASDGFMMELATTDSCNPGPCGNVNFQGSCTGAVLSYCEDEGTPLERLVNVDCATEAFPASVTGVCTLIDPIYGSDCAVADQDQCSFVDAAGDAVFGLCDGATPACLIDPGAGTASCQSNVGACEEAGFVPGCAGDYLLQDCQIVQPVALDCSTLGATCTVDQCTGVGEGNPCDANTLICDAALVCHGPTNSCQQSTSICDPSTHTTTCDGATLIACGLRSELLERIDCATAFAERGAVTCGLPFTCDGAGCQSTSVSCVGTQEGDSCDIGRNAFCGPGRSCIYEQAGARTVEGRCQSASNYGSCTPGASHVGCAGEVATFCYGNGTATAVEPGGFDCAATGSQCQVVNDEPVCVGPPGARCQDPALSPQTLYRCGDGSRCEGAVGDVLGTCVEIDAPDAGTIDMSSDGGVNLDAAAPDVGAETPDAGTAFDAGDNTKEDKEGCGCSTSSSDDVASAAMVLLLLAFCRRKSRPRGAILRRKLPREAPHGS